MASLTASLKERKQPKPKSKSIYLPTTERNRRVKKAPRQKSEAKKLRRTGRYKTFIVWVRKRDNNKCLECGTVSELTVHHIKEFAENPESRFDLDWCDTLCRDCHDIRHLNGNYSLWQDHVNKPWVRKFRGSVMKFLYTLRLKRLTQWIGKKEITQKAPVEISSGGETIGNILRAKGISLEDTHENRND